MGSIDSTALSVDDSSTIIEAELAGQNEAWSRLSDPSIPDGVARRSAYTQLRIAGSGELTWPFERSMGKVWLGEENNREVTPGMKLRRIRACLYRMSYRNKTPTMPIYQNVKCR